MSLINDIEGQQQLTRILLALRLSKPGFLRTGVVFYSNPEFFSTRLRGTSSSGFASWQPGTEYNLSTPDVSAVVEVYDLLKSFEPRQDRHARSLQLGLRAFTSLYSRDYVRPDDRLVDAITALEAVLRIDVELSFRSAFRVAGLLASTDDRRVEIFEAMRSYYDTRSKIVHGSELKARNETDLQNEEPLLEVARQLLRAFLRIAVQNVLNDQFYGELDAVLQHSTRRHHLRTQMGLA